MDYLPIIQDLEAALRVKESEHQVALDRVASLGAEHARAQQVESALAKSIMQTKASIRAMEIAMQNTPEEGDEE